MQVYVKERVESALWWNGTLFLVTQSEIKCAFPIDGKIDIVLLASFDIASYGKYVFKEKSTLSHLVLLKVMKKIP